MPEDPYAAYQQPAAVDPYAAYQAPVTPATQDKGGDPKTVIGFLGNVAEGTGKLIGQGAKLVGNALIAPSETGANMVTNAAKMGMGALEKGVRPVLAPVNRALGRGEIPVTPEEQHVNDLIDTYKQRYGGLQNIKDTLYNDPVGAAMDASMLMGGGGAALKGAAGLADAANASRVAGALRKGAGMANKAAVATNPAIQAVRAVPKVAAKVPGVNQALTAIQDRLVPFEPHAALTQAIKPRANKLHWNQAMETAVPDIKAAETAPIIDTETALNTIKQAKAQNRAALGQYRGPAYQMGTQVDLTPLADHMEATIPKTLLREATTSSDARAAVEALKDRASAYRTHVPLEEAEQLLIEANKELDSYYAKYPRQQWSALQTNPETAATFAKAQALRDSISNGLDAPGQGAGVRELQRRYGALLEMEGEIQRRQNVAARQQPVSLAQQIGKAKAAGKLAMAGAQALMGHGVGAAVDAASALGTNAVADWLKEQQMTNNLIKRAFAEYPHPARPFPTPTPVNIRGALGPGPIRMPATPDQSGITVQNATPQYNPSAPIGTPGRPQITSGSLKTPPPPDTSGPVRNAPKPYTSPTFGPKPIYSEQEIRHLASQAGKNPDAAVKLARQHGLLAPEDFTDIKPIQ